MQLEQPGDQDSGNITPQPELENEPLELDPADPNEPNDPDLVDPEEEDEEIDVGGRKFAMPKSAAATLKAERLMQADYTRKTQEVAETRKQIEAEREQIKQSAAQQQQFIKEVARVHAIDDQLAEFRAITPAQWDAMADEDPTGTQKLQIRMRNLEQARNEAAQAVTQKQTEHALAEERAFATQLQEADAYVQREIPGWTKERGQIINDFAQANGVKLDQAFAKLIILQPALIKLLDQAEKFHQLEKKQTAKPPAPKDPPPPVKRVGAASAAAKPDPAKMSTNAWMEERNKQLRGKR